MYTFYVMNVHLKFAPSVKASKFFCATLNKYCYACLRGLQSKAKILSEEEVYDPSFVPSKKVQLISCKRPEFNHYKGQRYDKFKPIPMASKGWLHKKSKGDFFIINNAVQDRKPEEDENLSFEESNLDPSIHNALRKLGLHTPTEIQHKGIPSILFGRNTILAAETGCGKTLAYLLPIMHHIVRWKKSKNDFPMNSPLALVITPNRELAQQIHEMILPFLEELQLNAKVIVGGHTKRLIMNPQFSDVDILVGTIGAISKLTTFKIYNMKLVRHVVLDEADSLLDDSFTVKLMPFLEHFSFNNRTDHTLGSFPSGAQLTLASATMPRGVVDTLAPVILPESLVSIKTKNLHHILSNIKQHFLRIGLSQKPAELLRIIKCKKRVPTIVFSTKTPTSQWLSMFLNENGVKCLNLNGEMTVEARAGKFAGFQSGETDVISCTDIGSRGLNTVQVQHVINYEFPLYIADYIHRCGRTGRMGTSHPGLVTNFISGPREVELVQKIESATRTGVELPNVNANIKRLIIHRVNRRS